MKPAPDPPPARVPGQGAGRTRVVLTAGAVGLGAVLALVAFVLVGAAAPTAALPGLSDAGLVVGWLLPVSRLGLDLAAVSTVGCMVYAAYLAPADGPELQPAARRALRAGSSCALLWAVIAVVGSVLTLADISGLPLRELSGSPDAWSSLVTVGPSRSLLIVAALAVVVCVSARRVSSAEGTLPVVVLAAVTLVPPVLTGHAGSHSNDEVATISLIVHVMAAAVWVGGLGAVLLFRRPSAVADALTVARFSGVALWCFLATGLSGLLNAWNQLTYGDSATTGLFTSRYGWLVLGKMAALGMLAGFGWWHRRHTLVELAADRPRAFRRFAGREVLVMIGTIALAVALSRTPTPVPVPVSTDIAGAFVTS